MTELMKQYEGESVERDVIKYFEDMSPKQQVVKAFYVQCLFQEFKKLEAINKWLEAQLTWRPVSEKPENADYYLVKTPNFIFKAYFDGEKFVKVVGQRLVGLLATHWLPIPPAPEGVIV